MSFPRYKKYKPSGVEWLGELPEHWDVVQTRRIVEIKKVIAGELGYDVFSITQNGFRVKDVESGEGQQSMDYSKYQIVDVGDLAMNGMDLLTGGVDIATTIGVTSPDYRVFAIRDESTCHDRFLLYICQMAYQNKIFYAFGKGSAQLGRWRLPREQFNEFGLPIPPLPEQTAIAAFLDRETAKIDGLVTEQRRLMKLLKEKRQAVISHAVTKGLNSDALMKPSGIEWLGDVPEHWDIGRVKTVSKFTTSGPRGWSEQVADEGALFIQSGDLNALLEVDFEKAKRVQVGDDAEAARTVLRDGDVVVCITGAKTGNVAICDLVPEVAYINQHLALIRPSKEILSRYLGVLLKSDFGQTYFEVSQYGLKQGLSLGNIREAPVLLPPLSEQTEVVDYIEIESAKLSTLIDEAQRAIDLLQERRIALISAAVAGQIDVRESGAVRLPKEKPYSSGFARQLLAAEILHHTHQYPTTGRVKLQKLIHLCEHIAEIDEVGAHYARKAAGPFDNKVMYGIAAGLAKQKWFRERKDGNRTIYSPLEKAGEHTKYLARWEDKLPVIEKVLKLLGKADTQQCEIVSTLYAAWNDQLIEGLNPTDEQIIHEASDPIRWHENKANIPAEKWPAALDWMRAKEITPKGFGSQTSRKP